MRNILFIGTDSNLSGASLCMVSLVKDLEKEGYNPIIVLPKIGEGLLYEYIKKQNIKCYVIKSYNWVTLLESSKIKDFVKYFIKKTLNLFAVKKIRKIIKDESIDTVHINTIFSYVGAKAALKEHVNLVWHIREILEYGHKAKFYNDKYAYSLINKSDKIITISKYVNDYYKKYLDSSKMSIVYDGLEIDKYLLKDKKIFTSSKCHFLLVGTIQESKGQKELLKALSIFKKNNKEDFELSLIGYSTDESKKELNDLIEELDLTKEVKYLGFKKDTLIYYEKADIAFMCSSGDAFGRITVEGCLAGCLVIGANIGATKEIIIDNESGLLYKSGDPEDLAKKIEYAIKNKDKMKKLADKSRQYASGMFTTEKTTKNVISIYNKLGGTNE